MQAPLGRRATALLAIAAALAGSLSSPSGRAGAGDTVSSLRAADAALAAKSRSVALELYGLESAHTRAAEEERVARARVAHVRAAAAQTARRLGHARRTLARAERLLAERLRALYVEGEADPLEVLLGSQSLGEAIERVEGLEAIAAHDRSIIRSMQAAKRRLTALVRRLAAREQRLGALQAAAAARALELSAAAAERRAYLSALTEQRRLAAERVAALRRVAAARVRAQQAAAAEEGPTSSAPTADVVAPLQPPAPAPTVAAEPTRADGTRTLTVVSTGYALRGMTASGVPVGWGIVAVDPSVIPLGTRMTIPGYGEGVAADTGGAVQGAIIDVWFPSTAQALAWGRRTVTITLH